MKNRYLSRSKDLIKFIGLVLLANLFYYHAYTQERAGHQIIQGQKAQERIPGAKYIKQSANHLLPTTIRFDHNENRTEAQFMAWISEVINHRPNIELREEDSYIDQLGFVRRTFIQWYDGVEVDQTYYYVHSKKGKITMAHGKVLNIPDLPIQPSLNADQALKFALQYVGAEKYKWELDFWESDIKSRKQDLNATYYPSGTLKIARKKSGDQTQFRLSYVFDICAASPDSEKRICVDAHTGEIIYDVPLESNCDPATVNTVFNGNQNINTDKYTATEWRLRDDCQVAEIWVRDWNSTTTTASPIEIDNTTNTWTTQDERFGGSVLWCTNQAYSYFLNRFGRSSYDNANGNVNAFINAIFGCGPGCTTANNASMSFTGGTMKVGLHNSGVLTNSYATIDIIGHEYAHAVTGATAALVYENEWGALNESFSDIFGETLERFVFGANDWLIGSERGTGSIRSMSNPNNFSDPDTYLGTFWFNISPPCDNTNDECGVHTNSGVQNFWFFLLTQGGSGTNDNGDAYDVSGIGILKAEQIAYRNLVTYLGTNSDYSDARDGSIQAAIDLYGVCSEEVRSVTDAWAAVGVGDPFLDVQASVSQDISCFGFLDGQATAVASFGQPPYSYDWSNGQSGATATNLAAGTYQVTATDAAGCTDVDAVTLVNPPLLSATINITSDYNGWPISCNGVCDGTAISEPVGGTPPYTYLWSASANNQITKEAVDLCAGDHSVVVTDNNGCITFAQVTLTEPPPLSVDAGEDQTIFFYDPDLACTQLMAQNEMGGVPPYTYNWSSGGNMASEEVCLETVEDTITMVTYYLTLTDANGCTAIDSVTVCYVDIRCGKGNGTKVRICHFPPGNADNAHTECVSLSALATHLAHGDHVANCGFESPCGNEMFAMMAPQDRRSLLVSALNHSEIFEVFPNPFQSVAQLRWILPEEDKVLIDIIDLNGKILQQIYQGPAKAGEIYDREISGETLAAGIYIARLKSTMYGTSRYKRFIVQ